MNLSKHLEQMRHDQWLDGVVQNFVCSDGTVVEFIDTHASHSDCIALPSHIRVVNGPKTWEMKRLIADDINKHNEVSR